ncbi:MAG: hypothetical protein R3B72_16080 [Polyangiaceae bacterium]
MDGIGPITNTRTIDDAIGEALSRLSDVPQTARIKRLMTEVRRYQDKVSAWEDDPPEPELQFEVIGELMSLLSLAMNATREGHLEEVPIDPSPSGTLHLVGPLRRPSGPELDLDLEDVVSPLPGTLTWDEASFDDDDPSLVPGMASIAEDRSRAVAALLEHASSSCPSSVPPRPTDSRPLAVDAAPSEKPRPSDRATPTDLQEQVTAEVVRPLREPWRTVSQNAGVTFRLLGVRPNGESRNLMLRLASGAELPAHHHETAELLYVLEGCLELAGENLHAGDCLRASPKLVSGSLRSIGETTVLLFDSDRRLGT